MRPAAAIARKLRSGQTAPLQRFKLWNETPHSVLAPKRTTKPSVDS
jgi:hypothetical protein